MTCTPDYIEPLSAWRLWRTVETPAGSRLRSLFHETDWPAREPLRASCLARQPPWLLRRLSRRPTHTAPEAGCSCGLYAAWPELLLEQIEGDPGGYIVGRVLLWGRIVECERGWRAELAYPEHLYVPAGESPRFALTDLAAYGVPVEQSRDATCELLAAVS